MVTQSKAAPGSGLKSDTLSKPIEEVLYAVCVPVFECMRVDGETTKQILFCRLNTQV